MFGLDAMVDDVGDEHRVQIFCDGNIVLCDPYQYSEVMRSRRDLRLKRGAGRAMKRRIGTQSNGVRGLLDL